MKKFTFYFSLICILILCTVAIYGMEAPKDNDVTVINKAEITDVDQLFIRAKNGISDCNVKEFLKNQNASLKSQGYSNKLQSYSTAQVLKETRKQNGSTEKTIAVTTFVEINNGDLTIVPKGSGSFTDDKWDSTIAVRAYSTRYWSTTTDSYGNTCYLLTKVTGGWENQDAQVVLSGRVVKYQCVGINMVTRLGDLSQRVNNSLTSNTYSYTTGFTKYMINGLDIGFAVGTSSDVKLTRGTISWYLYLNNFIES